MFGDLLLDELRSRLAGQLDQSRLSECQQLLHGRLWHLDVLVAPSEADRRDHRERLEEVPVHKGCDLLAYTVVGLVRSTQVASVEVDLEELRVDGHDTPV